MNSKHQYFSFSTTLGPMTIAGDEKGLTHLFFTRHTHTYFEKNDYILDSRRFKHEVKSITHYLIGKKEALENLNWNLGQTGTAFQRKVWKAMGGVKPGKTSTYGEIAQNMGDKKYARAVGGACNANPLLLLIPCHRIVASGGRLGGFALGSQLKKKLLKLES